MEIGLLAPLTGVAVCAVIGTALVRRYAQRHLLDLPNERSSHTAPTPRGGGVAIVVAYSLGIAWAWWSGSSSDALAVTLLGGGGMVALVGWIDDHGHVPVGLRLACHVLAFGWAVGWLGHLPPVDFGTGAVDLGWFGTAVLVVYSVWYLNLFNFMDGIDGIAATQTLCMLGGAAALVPAASGAHAPLLMLCAATAGFLVWNWPPARIFMGDAGSGFIGFCLGALALWTVVSGWLSPWVWLILGGVFLADATVTLLARWWSGAGVTVAHRSHAYQRLSRAWGGHRPVTLAVLALNLGWCFPFAIVAQDWPGAGAVLAALALAPLFLLAAWLGAGQPGEMRVPRRRRGAGQQD